VEGRVVALRTSPRLTSPATFCESSLLGSRYASVSPRMVIDDGAAAARTPGTIQPSSDQRRKAHGGPRSNPGNETRCFVMFSSIQVFSHRLRYDTVRRTPFLDSWLPIVSALPACANGKLGSSSAATVWGAVNERVAAVFFPVPGRERRRFHP